jgi:hypothetical protein
MSFVVTPPANAATGLYPIHVNLWARASGFGGEAENLFENVVMVPVGQVRSVAPIVTCPASDRIGTGDSSISGTTVESDGTVIRVYFDGILRCQTTASGGTWTCTGFTGTFGPLYGGLEIRATAQSVTPPELVCLFWVRCGVV